MKLGLFLQGLVTFMMAYQQMMMDAEPFQVQLNRPLGSLIQKHHGIHPKSVLLGLFATSITSLLMKQKLVGKALIVLTVA